MPTPISTRPVRLVTIDLGCIDCGQCESIAPEVFTMLDGSAVVRGSVRSDGRSDRNDLARSPLVLAAQTDHAEAIMDAAETCPIEIIHIE